MAAKTDTGPCFFCPSLPEVGERAKLEEEETHHASAARRIRVGDTIGLIDGAGVRATAVVESVSRNRLAFTIRERQRLPRPDPAIIVACAVPKGDRFRTLIDMLSQIGVAGLVPLLCERGAVKSRRSSGARWRRIAIEACKQSRNPYVPVIHEPLDVAGSLRQIDRDDTVAFADADGEPLTSLLPVSGTLFLYVGPEGGFSDSEKTLLRERDARPLRLADNILRVETAAIVGAATAMSGT